MGAGPAMKIDRNDPRNSETELRVQRLTLQERLLPAFKT